MSQQELSLVILSTDEDAALVLKPFCKQCVTNKLSAIRFCHIDSNDAKDLVRTCGVKVYKVKCICNEIKK